MSDCDNVYNGCRYISGKCEYCGEPPERGQDRVKAVLLVPEEYGDPHGLLSDGVCGSRPPMLYSGELCAYPEHQAWKTREDFFDHADCYMCNHPLRGLVLEWQGQRVPEGMDRAARCDPHYDASSGFWASPMALGKTLAELGLGRLIIVKEEE